MEEINPNDVEKESEFFFSSNPCGELDHVNLIGPSITFIPPDRISYIENLHGRLIDNMLQYMSQISLSVEGIRLSMGITKEYTATGQYDEEGFEIEL